MAVSDHVLLEAWKQVLGLCRLERGQCVTIITDPDTRQQTLSTAIAGAVFYGAIVNRLEFLPTNAELSLSRDKTAYVGSTPLTGNRTALAALKASDLILDMVLLLHSPEQNEVLAGGSRMLLVVEPPEILARLVPTQDDRTRVLAAARKLESARRMRVTSPGGTDLRLELGAYPLLKEYGFVEEPGRWDHWPSGFLATWANEGSANGRLVIDVGDILLPQKSYIQSPIELIIESGYVKKINGGLDAELLKDYMQSFRDPEAYAISHVGWGMQDRAHWSVMGLYDREASIAMDARAFAGNFLFSLGPNTEAGGSRNTPCHMDIPMRHCTIELDGDAVVRDGRVVGL
ncbi:MAG TPA: 2,5-dihydroxypyridine 5,6-dioxygenase [Steroidobacteraceae bacterium]|nr:2,5-dihydroxypyridine 5,6-dioxygenase [Steroidobacteraceae bacterium]